MKLSRFKKATLDFLAVLKILMNIPDTNFLPIKVHNAFMDAFQYIILDHILASDEEMPASAD